MEGLQNLRVLAAYDLAVMDDLVRDFTLALEESSKRTSMSGSRAQDIIRKKRRFKKRKPVHCHSLHTGNMSEASESSIDEAFKDYIENMTRQSDSDDYLIENSRQKIPSLSIFSSISAPLLVESDSVTENISPMRPQRRRRHLKRMAIDPDQQKKELANGLLDVDMDMEGNASVLDRLESGNVDMITGKRKRSVKDKSGSNSFDLDLSDSERQNR